MRVFLRSLVYYILLSYYINGFGQPRRFPMTLSRCSGRQTSEVNRREMTPRLWQDADDNQIILEKFVIARWCPRGGNRDHLKTVVAVHESVRRRSDEVRPVRFPEQFQRLREVNLVSLTDSGPDATDVDEHVQLLARTSTAEAS